MQNVAEGPTSRARVCFLVAVQNREVGSEAHVSLIPGLITIKSIPTAHIQSAEFETKDVLVKLKHF